MNMKDKVVWITGASSGIGRALALELSTRGAKLVLTARRADRLSEVRDACATPERTHLLPGDLFDAGSCQDLARRAAEFAGPVDVLVNNAGLGQRGLALRTSSDDVRRIMELNFHAPVALSTAVLPGMLERRSGQIVVVSSVAGYVGTPLRSTYAASKHAVRGYFDSLRAELHGSGVGVTVVCPGYVQTEITQHAIGEDGEVHGKNDKLTANGISASDAARSIAGAMDRGQSELLVGGREIYAVHMKRWFPGLVERVVPGQAPS